MQMQHPNVISNEASQHSYRLSYIDLPPSENSVDQENRDEVEGTMEGLVGNSMNKLRIQSSGKTMKTRS